MTTSYDPIAGARQAAAVENVGQIAPIVLYAYVGAMVKEYDRLADAVREFWAAEMDMHPIYGSTSACSGGVGGSMITEHCAHLCQSWKHDAARERYEFARSALWRALGGAS